MVEYNSYETPSIYTNLNDKQQFRLNKINEIIDYFVAEFKEKELMSEGPSKYVALSEYFDKSINCFIFNN